MKSCSHTCTVAVGEVCASVICCLRTSEFGLPISKDGPGGGGGGSRNWSDYLSLA